MRKLVILIGIILALLILFVPSYILWLTWQPPQPTVALLTPNTKNTIRLTLGKPRLPN